MGCSGFSLPRCSIWRVWVSLVVAFSVGLPLRLSGGYIARAVRAGYAVAEVREVDHLNRTCAARQVVSVWIPRAWRR
jgi:hypothetical protein